MSGGSSAERRQARLARRREARRTGLIEAARRRLAGAGIEGFTIAAVAEEADVSKPSVYYYFESKEALVGALAGELFAREVEVLRGAVEGAPDGVAALEALLRARVDLYRADPDAFRILYVWTQAVAVDAAALRAQIDHESGRLNDRLVERLEAERRAGHLRAGARARHLANLAWITAHGLLLLGANLAATGTETRLPVEELVDEACAALRLAASAAPSPGERTPAQPT